MKAKSIADEKINLITDCSKEEIPSIDNNVEKIGIVAKNKLANIICENASFLSFISLSKMVMVYKN